MTSLREEGGGARRDVAWVGAFSAMEKIRRRNRSYLVKGP